MFDADAHYCATLCVLFSLVLVFPATPKPSHRSTSIRELGIEVIIPTVIPALFQSVTARQRRPAHPAHTTLITNAWFDAIAPYHPTAKGSTRGWTGVRPECHQQEQEHRDGLRDVPPAEPADAAFAADWRR